MKQINSIFKFLGLVLAMVTLANVNVFASSKTYYAKATATSTGNGKVYVATSNSAPADDAYAETSEAANSASSTSSSTNVSFYLFAQPAEGFVLDGWYTDAECTTGKSTNNPYTARVNSNSTDEAAPVVGNWYAKFVEAVKFYSSMNASAVGEGKVNVSLTTTAGEYAAASEATQGLVNTTSHTYYLKAEANDGDYTEFDGWYSDAACTQKLTDATTYTYKVDVTSNTESAPTAFNAYAKFVARDMYQVRNGGFERWIADNEVGYGWNSFQSATGSMAGTGKGMSPNPERVEGRGGSGYAVQLTSKYAGAFGIGANANGNLTTGTVNMGSMTPTDADNHNYSDMEDPTHHLLIIGQPDAVEFYTKYKMGDGDAHTGHAQFYLHDKVKFIDPVTEDEESHIIATNSIDIPESEEWIRNYGEFTYEWDVETAAASEKYLLINITTNITPGGSIKDTLIIDDMRLIYNSELKVAKVNDTELVFSNGTATVNAEYNAEALTLTSNGRAAKIETSYNEKTAVLTVTVKGENISSEPANQHVYTIQYNLPTGITTHAVKTADNTIYNLNGQRINANVKGIKIVGGKKTLSPALSR